MKTPLKLNSIDQEHLQELYDSSGVARDELPYSAEFDTIVQGFQDRTFKNADHEQLFGAILKYVRSSSNAAKEVPAVELNEEQLKQLKVVISRHGSGGKMLPYSDQFNSAHAEFNKVSGASLSDQDFWRSLQRMHGTKRKPPKRVKVAAAKADSDEEDGE
ncbi:MAG: hypothetical protein JWP03_3066 [Phycisphaerales bacterium]|jgi:hypothetical protein|nr:hypothetical protein [Phycisphaerales bacterium]